MPQASSPRLPTGVLAQPVSGRNLLGESLGDALRPGPTLLVFLRHFG
jgi:hypothetical protein